MNRWNGIKVTVINALERSTVMKTSPHAGYKNTGFTKNLHVPSLDAKDFGKGLDPSDGSWTGRVIEDIEDKIVAVVALILDRSHHALATRK